MPLYWLCYRGMDCGMTQVSKVALLLFLLLFSVTTNAQTCVKIDDDNGPAAIVSGRITTHHKLPKGSGRQAQWCVRQQCPFDPVALAERANVELAN
jgi:hypothetical protein